MTMIRFAVLLALICMSLQSATAMYAGPPPGHYCGSYMGTFSFFTIWNPNQFEMAFFSAEENCNIVGPVFTDPNTGLMTMIPAGFCNNFTIKYGYFNSTLNTVRLYGKMSSGQQFYIDYADSSSAACQAAMIPEADYCAPMAGGHNVVFTADENFGYTFNIMDPHGLHACRGSGSFFRIGTNVVVTLFSQCENFKFLRGTWNDGGLELIGTSHGKVWQANATRALCNKGALKPQVVCGAIDGIAGSPGTVVHFGHLAYLGTAPTSYQQTIFNQPTPYGQFSARGGYWAEPNRFLALSHALSHADGIVPSTKARIYNGTLFMEGTQNGNPFTSSLSADRCQTIIAPNRSFAGTSIDGNVSIEIVMNDHGFNNTFTMHTTIAGHFERCTKIGHYWLNENGQPANLPVQFRSFYTTCSVEIQLNYVQYNTSGQNFLFVVRPTLLASNVSVEVVPTN